MSVISFVQNYDDLSTDRGFQFKFHCDHCGNGYLSSFQPSLVGTAGSLLRAAGDVFGGWLNSAGNSAYELQRAVGGKAHDAALNEAVQEGKQKFKQCTRCGKWVCPEVCWNEQANLCEGCAPKFEEELAASQAQAKAEAARQQLFTKAQSVDYVSQVDMSADAIVRAPEHAEAGPPPGTRFCANCGVPVGSAKFCPECGKPVTALKPKCSRCGFEPAEAVKFCPECGNRI